MSHRSEGERAAYVHGTRVLVHTAIAALAVAGCHKKAKVIDAAPLVPTDAALDARAIDGAIAVATPTPTSIAVATPTPTSIAVGTSAACAVMSDRSVRCWGKNSRGQLGDGSTTDSLTPVAPALRGVRELQLAGDTACALLEDASVSCWGHIAWQGKTATTPKPTGILGVKGVKQLFVLPRSACGRVADDSLVCWGGVDPGGHATASSAEDRHYPTPLAGLTHVTALHPTAALVDGGEVYLETTKPLKAPLDAAVEIAERDGMVCRRDAAGGVRCAGDRLACLPQPNLAPKPAPKPLPKGKRRPLPPPPSKPEPTDFALAFPAARQLAFASGLCVVTTTGKLTCGDGCGKSTPRRGLDKLDAVVGDCGRTTDGAIRCWRGDTVIPIEGVTTATALAAVDVHGCALLDNATLTCWDDRGAPTAIAF